MEKPIPLNADASMTVGNIILTGEPGLQIFPEMEGDLILETEEDQRRVLYQISRRSHGLESLHLLTLGRCSRDRSKLVSLKKTDIILKTGAFSSDFQLLLYLIHCKVFLLSLPHISNYS